MPFRQRQILIADISILLRRADGEDPNANVQLSYGVDEIEKDIRIVLKALHRLLPAEGDAAERRQMENGDRLKFVNDVFHLLFGQEIDPFETDLYIFVVIEPKIGSMHVQAFDKENIPRILEIVDKMPCDKTGKPGDQVFIQSHPPSDTAPLSGFHSDLPRRAVRPIRLFNIRNETFEFLPKLDKSSFR